MSESKSRRTCPLCGVSASDRTYRMFSTGCPHCQGWVREPEDFGGIVREVTLAGRPAIIFREAEKLWRRGRGSWQSRATQPWPAPWVPLVAMPGWWP